MFRATFRSGNKFNGYALPALVAIEKRAEIKQNVMGNYKDTKFMCTKVFFSMTDMVKCAGNSRVWLRR